MDSKNSAKLLLNIEGKEQELDLPVVMGTEGDIAIDMRSLRKETRLRVAGPCLRQHRFHHQRHHLHRRRTRAFLRYRGIPIEQLGEHSTFIETSYLLINGRLPNRQELSDYSTSLTMHSLIHEDMKHFFDGYPSEAHPMAILSAMVCSLSSFYPKSLDATNHEIFDITATRVLSKVRTLAAFSYKKSIGQPFMYPRNELSYCANMMHMMFANPCEPYELDDEVVKVVNLLLILHADHEQNCSTSTVRLVGSGRANLFASLSAGICALWGPRHGGANQEVIHMLEEIQRDGGDVSKFVNLAKDKTSNFRLMGFGTPSLQEF